MKYTLRELAELVKGELIGDPEVLITGISGIKEAKKGDITFLANSKYSSLMKATKASAIITSKEIVKTEKSADFTLKNKISGDRDGELRNTLKNIKWLFYLSFRKFQLRLQHLRSEKNKILIR